MTTAKISLSLPKELVVLTEEIARERKVSRSKVISSCLQEMADRRKVAEMEEGYRVMAKEHGKFAKLASVIAHEVVPEW